MTEDCGFSFIKFPRALISNPEFKSISIEGRFLFSLILDRYGVSILNSDKFTDENGEICVIYTMEEVCEKLSCSYTKANRLFKEIESFGLITRKRKNRLAPYRIYVSNLFYDIVNCEVTTYLNVNSRDIKMKSHDVSKCKDIYNNKINNNQINNNPSIRVTEDEISEQIEYDCVVHDGNRKMLDEIVMLMYEVMNGLSPTVRIGKEEITREDAVKRFRSLDSEHIDFVISCIDTNKTQIKSFKPYLITMLYNAPATMENWLNSIFAYYNQ
ncbi:MAG: replication initiator protein A [Clostridia bacterium]|nr:replication initiator protein A [Clostridia bacterium]